MFRFGLVFVLGLIFTLLCTGREEAHAEPWIANRMAQNCSGCHAPGRINRIPEERRCTLSCQGCHVNPNGGGLRSQYGKWTEERWLRSFRSKITWAAKEAPVPLKDQVYSKKPKELPKELRRNLKKTVLDMDKGLPLKTTPSLDPVEKEFDRYADPYDVIAESKLHDLYSIPKDDPLRLERTLPVYGGGDLRFFYIQGDLENVPEDEMPLFWPMALDAGLRIRPIRKNLQLVLETRWLNTVDGSVDQLFTNSVITRSAYALVDELPYNSYVMYGLFRPMFGNYQPDHTALAQELSDLDHDSVFKGISIGSAPNVPFANITLIRPIENPNRTPEEGFVGNLGLRFVSYGASIVGSYWSTQSDIVGMTQKKNMMALNLGANISGWIPNFEFLLVDFRLGTSRSKYNVFTLENKIKLWRENYMIANVATANVATTRNPGSTFETYLGMRNYWLAGLSTEILFKNRTEEREGLGEISEQALILQAHGYF